jgi:hypothetical protein
MGFLNLNLTSCRPQNPPLMRRGPDAPDLAGARRATRRPHGRLRRPPLHLHLALRFLQRRLDHPYRAPPLRVLNLLVALVELALRRLHPLLLGDAGLDHHRPSLLPCAVDLGGQCLLGRRCDLSLSFRGRRRHDTTATEDWWVRVSWDREPCLPWPLRRSGRRWELPLDSSGTPASSSPG